MPAPVALAPWLRAVHFLVVRAPTALFLPSRQQQWGQWDLASQPEADSEVEELAEVLQVY